MWLDKEDLVIIIISLGLFSFVKKNLDVSDQSYRFELQVVSRCSAVEVVMNRWPCEENQSQGLVVERQKCKMSKCDWVLCPGLYNITTKPLNGKKRMMIAISGQLSRLELKSKIFHLFYPNIEDYQLFAVFFLKIGTLKASNYRNRGNGPYRIHNWKDASEMKKFIQRVFPSITPVHIEVICNPRIKGGIERQTFYFVIKDSKGQPSIPVAFSLVAEHEPDGYPELIPNFVVKEWEQPRQGFQQDMFRNIRKTMQLVEEIEERTGLFMDYVFRVREDTFVLEPHKIELKLPPNIFLTPECWTNGGLGDVNFLMGRLVASEILRGLAEDYYFRLKSHYINPEHFVRSLALYSSSNITFLHACRWPLIPIIWLDQNGMKMQFRPTSILQATTGCVTRKRFNGYCVWRDNVRVHNRTIEKYDRSGFNFWSMNSTN